ncbi:MAG: flagellar basal body-associated FliL family protein [Bacteroidetes bacterium]|nr:flagellar basal body-associated FliL family protein [Bacteroidota bacterium]MCW5895105.1 flagellar basal body-associated FliL family protein [Bacteroidota bacterium]
MADEKPTPEQPAETPESKKDGLGKRILIFGIPVFLVQFVVVYFLVAKFVVPVAAQNQTEPAVEQSGHEQEAAKTDKKESKEQHIYAVKDLIINPAATNGQRYLLTTIAFDLSSNDALKSLEKKEMAVRDALNSILTSKTMDQLIDVSKRESLREEIAGKVANLVDHGTLQSVYFSKYIIQ